MRTFDYASERVAGQPTLAVGPVVEATPAPTPLPAPVEAPRAALVEAPRAALAATELVREPAGEVRPTAVPTAPPVARAAPEPAAGAAPEPPANPAPATTARAAAPAQPVPSRGTVLASTGDPEVRLRIRREPSLSAPIIGRVPNGDRMTIVAGPRQVSGSNWLQIRYGSLTGWVSAAYVRAAP